MRNGVKSALAAARCRLRGATALGSKPVARREVTSDGATTPFEGRVSHWTWHTCALPDKLRCSTQGIRHATSVCGYSWRVGKDSGRVSAMPTLCRGFCTTTTVEEGRQQHSFEESISSQTSLDGLSALCIKESQNFDSDDASSAILLASMMLLDPSCACDKESLSKAIGCLSARCLDLMPNFGPNNIADSLFGYALASSRGFPMSPDLTEAIIVRLWVPEDQGGVKLAPYHSSQMILSIGHLDVESRGPDLVATVCMRAVETLAGYDATDCTNALVGLSMMGFPDEMLLAILPETAAKLAGEMNPDQLSDTMSALSRLTVQAKRLDENHPGFVADFTIQQLAFTSTQKAKEMNASSLTSTLSSLAHLGFLPSSEDWAVYADCIQSLSGALQGRHVCDLLQCIGDMGSGDLGGDELGKMLASFSNLDVNDMNPSERAALVDALDHVADVAVSDPLSIDAFRKLEAAAKGTRQ